MAHSGGLRDSGSRRRPQPVGVHGVGTWHRQSAIPRAQVVPAVLDRVTYIRSSKAVCLGRDIRSSGCRENLSSSYIDVD